jgi:hypothetical protein
MSNTLVDGIMLTEIYAGAENPFDMTDAEIEKPELHSRSSCP